MPALCSVNVRTTNVSTAKGLEKRAKRLDVDIAELLLPPVTEMTVSERTGNVIGAT